MITLDNFKHGFMVECDKCKVLQDKRLSMRGGKWIPMKSSKYRVGFHISQLLSPLITREEIEQKKADFSESKFKNEVMGEFYSGAGIPLEEREVIARCAEPYKHLAFEGAIRAPQQTFIGIDWGGRNEQKDKGAYTVFTALSRDGKTGKYKLEYAERIMYKDINKQIKYCIDLITLYNGVSVVVDLGFGQHQCNELQKYFQNRVKGCMYFTNLKNKMKYDKDTWTLSVDRNGYLEDIIEIVKRGNFIIPYKHPDKVNWYVKQMCNTELRYKEHKGNVSREYEKLTRYAPNDALHSLCYSYIASAIHLGEGGFGNPGNNSSFNQSMPAPILTSFNGRPQRIGGPSVNPIYRGSR